MKKKILLLMCLWSLIFNIKAQTKGPETIVIDTRFGIMKLKLYVETPVHKANFIKLVKAKFFDSLLFHRVINNFMIQSGDQLSKNAKPGDSIGHGDLGYTVPAEFNSKLMHKKGSLAAAREGDDVNPKFESSASQFYIVMGKKRSVEDLKKQEDRINKTHQANCARAFIRSDEGKAMKRIYNRLKTENKTDSAEIVNAKISELINAEHLKTPEYKFSKQQIDAYTTVGGAPHLDGTYTVFGEVTEGLEIIDKIAAAKTDKKDRPLEDLRIKITLIE